MAARNFTEHGGAHLLARAVRTYHKRSGTDGASPPFSVAGPLRPRSQNLMNASSTHAKTAHPAPAKAGPADQRRVLIAEDNEPARQQMRDLLEAEHGLLVDTAGD